MTTVADWLDAFVAAVRSGDAAAGRDLFAGDAIGFGTRAAHTVGRDALERDQWSHVWPLVAAWDVSDLAVVVDDGQVAVLTYRWRRTNRDATVHRGRATMVLVADPAAPHHWRCTHSHFSVDPG